MGPLWTIIGQKLSEGTIAAGSELELEIAEVSCHGLHLDGSLRVLANRPTGQGSGKYSDMVGRARLHNVAIVNKGLKSRLPKEVLSAALERSESCEIILEGFSELVAENVTINGPFHLTVPDGKRAILHQEASGTVTAVLEPIAAPSWHYAVEWKSGEAPVLTVAS